MVHKSNYEFVTGLRAIAALYVLLSHVWYEIWPAVPPPYGYGKRPEALIGWLTGWLYYGHFGVVIFIVVSGFCLMLPVVRNNGVLEGGLLTFFQRRARRIVPPYYFALALTLLVIASCLDRKTGTQWDISIPVTAEGVLSHVLFFHDFTETTQINYVFWSIAVEAHLYLLFPTLVWIMHRFGVTLATGAICGAVYTVIVLLEFYDYHDIPPQFIGLCAYFVFGMACAKLIHLPVSEPRGFVARAPWAGIALTLVSMTALLCAMWGFDVAERRFALLDSFVAISAASLLIAAAKPNAFCLVRWLLERQGLVAIGTFSYSLYLVHAPILQLVWQFVIAPWGLPDAQQFLLLLILAGPASLGIAAVFYVLCERPFLVRRREVAPVTC